MSWLYALTNPTAAPPAPPREAEDSEPKVADPAIPGRMVVNKTANKPYLSYKHYRERQEAEHAAWAVRQKEREEKIARGEDVGPAERDPTEEQEVGCLGLLKLLVVLLLFGALAGKFFTGSWTWEQGQSLKQFWPSNDRLFSEKQLARFDGTDTRKPIYLAIGGLVYDVSSNRHTYGPGGGYNVFAGKDASRAYITGCFKEHQTHDLRGLSETELASLDHWKKFFANHKSYPRIGRVALKPIDPASPIPAPCKQGGEEPKQEQKQQPVYGPKRRDEL